MVKIIEKQWEKPPMVKKCKFLKVRDTKTKEEKNYIYKAKLEKSVIDKGSDGKPFFEIINFLDKDMNIIDVDIEEVLKHKYVEKKPKENKIKKVVKKKKTKKVTEKKQVKKLSDQEILTKLIEISEIEIPLQKNKELKLLKEKSNYSLQELKDQLKYIEKDKETEKKEGKSEKKKDNFDEKKFYEKYIGKVTCAYEKDIKVDKDGKERCYAKRTQEKEKYLFKGITPDVVLIECPNPILTIEYEKEIKIKEEVKTVDSKQIKEWIKQTCENAKDHEIDFCIVDHGGTSPYFYACNFKNLIENREKECKKEIAKLIVPKEALEFLDLSNLGNTLIPIINRPHWKKKKYNGAIHKIVKGKNPDEHKNKVPDVVLQRIFDNERPNFPKTQKYGDSDINSISLSSVISTAGLKKRGQEYQGSNPWHGSGTGMNFVFNPSKNVWHCFRCGAGGSVAKAIALNKRIINSCDEDLSATQFKQVLEIAREEYGLKKPESKHKTDEASQFFLRLKQAEKFIEIQPLFYDKAKIWWMWNFKSYCYEMVDETDVLNGISKEINIDTTNTTTRTEILNGLKQVGRRSIPKEARKSWIQFKDVIVDVKTGEEFKASPEYFVTNPIPWEIGESEETPTIDRLFTEWVVMEGVQDESYVDTLYEMVAYSGLSHQFLQRLFALTGIGSNGKGCYEKLVEKYLGEDNISTSELKLLSNRQFESSALYKKQACMMGEVDVYDMQNTNLLKKLSGEDKIRYEFKGKTPFSEKSGTTCFMATNSLPITPDPSPGFYRRWLIVDFPHIFPVGKDVVGEIPNEEFNNLAKKCIRICKELYEKKNFANEGDIEERMKRYEERSNPLIKFIETEAIEDPEEHTIFQDFYKRFNTYLKRNRLRLMTKIRISRGLRDEGFQVKGKKTMIEDKEIQTTCVFGIKLKDEITTSYQNLLLSKINSHVKNDLKKQSFPVRSNNQIKEKQQKNAKKPKKVEENEIDFSKSGIKEALEGKENE